MAKGTYTLLVELVDSAAVEFGAAGERDLRAGWYAYTGTAFGPGGFARVERHRELARGERDARHWHVDYLLGHPASRIAEVVKTPERDVECEVSQRLGTGDRPASSERLGTGDGPGPGEPEVAPVAGLGASDCDCDSHLYFSPDSEKLAVGVRRAHDSVRE